MRRRNFLATLPALPAALTSCPVWAQPSAPLIVVLMHGKETALPGRIGWLVDGLRELGYVEGRDYRMEVRWSDNQLERLPTLARELLAGKPDVAVAFPVLSAQALQRESKTVPIVMAAGSGAQRIGLIGSLSRPGSNVTGINNQLDELSAKQLQLLRDVAPDAKRVMTLSSGLGAAEPDIREGSRLAANALGMTLIEALADKPSALAQVSADCERSNCDAMVVLVDPNVQSFRSEIIAVASRLRIPAVYPTSDFADDGGLVVYSVDGRSLWRRAASFVDRILKGAKPANLPVEGPTKFELVLNMRTATALGISFPQSLLIRADRLVR